MTVEMGFDGKQAIHPNQIEVIYQCFTPPQGSIDFARKIVEESKKHFSQGVGAWEIEGKMIDAPMIKVRLWSLNGDQSQDSI